ncbi:hypothetical protein [Paenibacillus elgii]|uniref:hypothetical protein n=2 Tax=Paenibacillus TaxID=44249 RepID=UPI000492AE7B|nr:hypothetical protein [Paenibacillus elgii]MCM3274332.1 hypothetical protein [Paenibacillus elgii]
MRNFMPKVNRAVLVNPRGTRVKKVSDNGIMVVPSSLSREQIRSEMKLIIEKDQRQSHVK